MTTTHISDNILIIAALGVTSEKSYSTALEILKLDNEYYLTNEEFELLIDAMYDYEIRNTGFTLGEF